MPSKSPAMVQEDMKTESSELSASFKTQGRDNYTQMQMTAGTPWDV